MWSRRESKGYPEKQFWDVAMVTLKDGKVDPTMTGSDVVAVRLVNAEQKEALKMFPTRVQWKAKVYDYAGQGIIMASSQGIEADHEAAEAVCNAWLLPECEKVRRTPDELAAWDAAEEALVKSRAQMSAEDALKAGADPDDK